MINIVDSERIVGVISEDINHKSSFLCLPINPDF